MENKKQFLRRSNLLVAVYLVCLAVFVGILYDAQIVNGKDYRAQSSIQVTTTEPVESSRGIITDRNGKVLVSNREIYTITFDPDEVKDDPALTLGENGSVHSESVANALLRLLRLLQQQGLEWDDGLPVSADPPFAYTFSEASGTRRTWFQSYLADRKWSSTEITAATKHPLMSPEAQKEFNLPTSSALSAAQLVELMRKDFGIPESFTDREARLVLGILYEVKLRQLEKNAATVPYFLVEQIRAAVSYRLRRPYTGTSGRHRQPGGAGRAQRRLQRRQGGGRGHVPLPFLSMGRSGGKKRRRAGL